MKKYVLKFTKKEEIIGVFKDKLYSFDVMMSVIERHNYGIRRDDNDYITPFDFTLEEMEHEDVNVIINNGYKAAKYLNCKFSSSVDVTSKHEKAISALRDLVIIAEAWNKADGFVPDFSNRNQPKWFTWFAYDTNTAGFVAAYTNSSATFTTATFGSRICFKSSERAAQFGTQFIDLWNNFLLFRE